MSDNMGFSIPTVCLSNNLMTCMTRNFLSTQERTQLCLKENGDVNLSLLLKSKFLIATISTWLSQLFFSDLFLYMIHGTGGTSPWVKG